MNIFSKETSSYRTYFGVSKGNWRLREKEKLNEFDKASDLDKEVFSFFIEKDKQINKHMYILGGLGYEGSYVTKKNSSYDIIPIYIGGRIEYFNNALWNPYFVGRIGHPFYTNIKNTDIDDKDRNGWASMGFGLKYNKNFLYEFIYKQHITNYYPEDKEYDTRLLSLNIGYIF